MAGQAYDGLETVLLPQFAEHEMIYGGSLYIAGRTAVGPLALGLGAISTDSRGPVDRGRASDW